MGQAQLEIVLTEAGGSAAGSTVTSNPPPNAANPAAGSQGYQAGTNVTSPTDALSMLSQTLGFGQIQAGVTLLIRAFTELTAAIDGTASAQATTKLPNTSNKAKPQLPKTTGGEEAAKGAAAAEGAEGAEGGAGAAAGSAASVAGPLILATVAIVGLGYAAKKTADALDAEADKLSQYSASISEAMARADLRQQFAEMERAGKLEDSLSKFEDNYSKAQTEAYKTWTSIEEALLEVVNPILEEMLPFIKPAGDAVVATAEMTAAIFELLTLHIPTALDLAGKSLDTIDKMATDIEHMGDAQDDPLTADPFTEAAIGRIIPIPGQGPAIAPVGFLQQIRNAAAALGAAAARGGI